MNLVIQGSDVETTDLKQLAKLTGASAIERLTAEAFVLRGASTAETVSGVCERAHLDHGYVPEERRLEQYRLLVMDMDSTLITMETIDELADLVGLKAEVAAITGRAMRGEIDYDESLRRRLALLKDLDESALERVYTERLQLSPGAETLLAAAQSRGIKTLLVSGGFSFITDRLKVRLRLDYAHANLLGTRDGKLTGEVIGDIVNADAKRAELLRVRDALGLRREEIIGIGDGANDLKFLGESGVSIAYHAKPVVREHATYALNYVGLGGVLPLFNAGA
jgi:phosphoserine phosphatase